MYFSRKDIWRCRGLRLQGRTQEFVQGGLTIFSFPGEGGRSIRWDLKTFPWNQYISLVEGACPPLNTPLAGLGCAVHCFYLKESEMYGNGKIWFIYVSLLLLHYWLSLAIHFIRVSLKSGQNKFFGIFFGQT